MADPAGRLISSLYLSNPTTQASDSRYFQYDGLGSVIGRTNQQGNAVSNYSYEAFGAITSQKGQDSNAYTYMGQAYDTSTGLYYFNARWYDASIGRFISADPLPGNPFESGSTNRYAYALDNPIAYEDVSGLKSARMAQAGNPPPPLNWDRINVYLSIFLVAIFALVLLAALGFEVLAVGLLVALLALAVGALLGGLLELGHQIGLGKSLDQIDWSAVINKTLDGASLAAVVVILAIFFPSLVPFITTGLTPWGVIAASVIFFLWGLKDGYIEQATPDPTPAPVP